MKTADCQLEAVRAVHEAMRLINGVMDVWLSDGKHFTTPATRNEAVMLLNAQKKALEALAAVCSAEAEHG